MNLSENAQNVPINVPVNKTQRKILELLQANNNLTYENLAVTLNLNRKTIMRNLNDLKNKNLIHRVGSNKSGYWEII